MTAIDEFASTLLEEAKRFLEKSGDGGAGTQAYLHASLVLGFCALEAHTNAIADEFSNNRNLHPADRAVLLEKEVKLEHGEFKLGRLKMHRLEDRILFLHKRFSGKALDRQAAWWSELSSAQSLRNQLTHPRNVPVITYSDVKRAIEAIIEGINVLFQAIYQRPFPAANRRLQSRLDF